MIMYIVLYKNAFSVESLTRFSDSTLNALLSTNYSHERKCTDVDKAFEIAALN